jgi:hypothetical protein
MRLTAEPKRTADKETLTKDTHTASRMPYVYKRKTVTILASPIFTPGTATSGGIRDSIKDKIIARATEAESAVSFFTFIKLSPFPWLLL